jgi:hypothetical protein
MISDNHRSSEVQELLHLDRLFPPRPSVAHGQGSRRPTSTVAVTAAADDDDADAADDATTTSMLIPGPGPAPRIFSNVNCIDHAAWEYTIATESKKQHQYHGRGSIALELVSDNVDIEGGDANAMVISNSMKRLQNLHELELPFKQPTRTRYVLMVIKAFVSFSLPVYTLYLTLMNLQSAVDSKSSSKQDTLFMVLYFMSRNFPLYTGWILLYATVNHVALQYLYYTFMRYGILVQFEKKPLYKRFFLYFMLAITILFALVEYHFTHEFRTPLGVIVLQCFQLLLFYNSAIVNSEDTLVSLNKFVQTAPVQAREVLQATIIIQQNRLREVVCEVVATLESAKRHHQLAFVLAVFCKQPLVEQIVEQNRVDMWRIRADIIAKLRTGTPPVPLSYCFARLWPLRFLANFHFLPTRDSKMGKALVVTMITLAWCFTLIQTVLSIVVSGG